MSVSNTSRRRPSAPLRFLTLPLLGLAVCPANADAQTQLTSNVESGCILAAPSSNFTGQVIAFESNCDLTGLNADGNREIFVYDEGAGTVTQITMTASCANTSPSIDDNDTGVAFDSDCIIDGANPDQNVEIFHWDGANSSPVTNSALCTNARPHLGKRGDLIAFDSNCDHVGLNSDFSNEIFQGTITGIVQQITNDASLSGCGSFNPSSTFAGGVLAFESDCDLAGSNGDGIGEIFSVVTGDGTVTQLTADPNDSGCSSRNPSIARDGGFVAFESDCDLTGGNGDEFTEIFRAEIGGSVFQLTDDDGTTGCESTGPEASVDGNSVLYESSCDPFGNNADGNLEIFEATQNGGVQHTDSTTCDSVDPVPSSDELLGAFVSDCDYAGANTVGADQLYSFSLCACGAPSTRAAGSPVATDALFALQAAVALADCKLCDCDVDNSGGNTATDALAILNAAVGNPVDLTLSLIHI